MSFMTVGMVGGGALLGGIGGALKSGPNLNTAGREGMAGSISAYKNLVAAGANASDVGNALTASRDYASLLGNTATRGMYDMSAGQALAQQQFAGQRQALAQSLQDQMNIANRAANASGRGSNDPILRARLGAEAMRQNASLTAQQSAAAMDLGRQSVEDTLNLRGQQVNTLQGLSDQAFNNQSNLFNLYNSLQQTDLGIAGYEMSRGGGLKGALTGIVAGAGAGMQMATGFSGMQNAAAMTNSQVTLNNKMPGLMREQMRSQEKAMASIPASNYYATSPYFNPANYAQPAPIVGSTVPRVGPSSLGSLANVGIFPTGTSTPKMLDRSSASGAAGFYSHFGAKY